MNVSSAPTRADTFEQLKTKLEKIGLRYVIEEQVSRADGSIYQWASIIAPISSPGHRKRWASRRIMVLISDGWFNFWVLSDPSGEAEGVIDNICASIYCAANNGILTPSQSDEWIEIACREGDERVTNPSRVWLTGHIASQSHQDGG